MFLAFLNTNTSLIIKNINAKIKPTIEMTIKTI